MRSDVLEDKEAGECSGQEYQNESQRTHFLSSSVILSETRAYVRGIGVFTCEYDYVAGWIKMEREVGEVKCCFFTKRAILVVRSRNVRRRE